MALGNRLGWQVDKNFINPKNEKIMAKNNNNTVFDQNIVKHLVKSVKEYELSQLMTYLGQPVILFLLGEFVPYEEGNKIELKDYPEAEVLEVNYLQGTYRIKYLRTDKKYFKSQEEADKYSNSGDYNWRDSEDSQDEEYKFLGMYSRKSETEISWMSV